MGPGVIPESHPSFPPELIYAIIDTSISNEARLKEIAPEDVLTFHPDPTVLLPWMLTSTSFYRQVIPLIFRDIQCSSAARLHSLRALFQENPSLASNVKRFRIQHQQGDDQWFEDPLLEEVLRTLVAQSDGGLEGLVIQGCQTSSSSKEVSLFPNIESALMPVLRQPRGLRHLHLSQLTVSLHFLDCLGGIDVICLGLHRTHVPSYDIELYRQLHQAASPPPIETLKFTCLSIAGQGFNMFMRLWGSLRPRMTADHHFPYLNKIILQDHWFIVPSKRELVKMKSEAPNLQTLRFIAHNWKPLSTFHTINELCGGSVLFRHLEIVQSYFKLIQPSSIPDSNVINFLSKVTMPLGLETLTILLSTSQLESGLWNGSAHVDPVFREKKVELYRVLDQPFYSKLRRVVLDFTDISFNHAHIFSEMLSLIHQSFPEEEFEGSYVKFSLKHRF